MRRGGQAKEGIVGGEKVPLSWSDWRRGGQSMVGEAGDSGLLRKVERGRRRETRWRRLWIAFLSCGKGMGSETRERSRWERLRHLESAGRLLELASC